MAYLPGSLLSSSPPLLSFTLQTFFPTRSDSIWNEVKREKMHEQTQTSRFISVLSLNVIKQTSYCENKHPHPIMSQFLFLSPTISGAQLVAERSMRQELTLTEPLICTSSSSKALLLVSRCHCVQKPGSLSMFAVFLHEPLFSQCVCV